jgi:hypothetical protein
MTAVEQRILETLLELETTVRELPRTQPKPSLIPFFDRLDVLTRELPPDADPSLLHYLHKKSYEKARLWLQDRQP